jgi:hypothetical protein
MGAAEKRTKSQAMAADLIKRGFPHGRRQTRPAANSGGLTMDMSPGSSKFKRLMGKSKKK